MRKSDEERLKERIEEFNKKVIHWIWIIFVSFITALIVVMLSTK